MAIDMDDPCAVAAALRAAYLALISGERAQTVTFEAEGGVKRTTTYHRADVDALRRELGRYETACAATTAGAARRFALRTGGC